VKNRYLYLALALSVSTVRWSDAAEIDFRRDIAPIFERRCLSCHNGAEKKGNLSLQTEKEAFAGGENGAAIEPGKPAASLLLDYISGDKPEMPKKGPPLKKEEVALIRDWIAAGAKWPADLALLDRAVADSNWWSLQPLVRPPLPKLAAEDEKRVRTPIDAFILAKLREKQLAPSPEADKLTLLRRLYFDLTGLPPTPEETAEFLNDSSPRAYEKLVDRLLESPRYGERWARHWLDVVHYADTHGYDKDKLRPNAWPYRDYVIRSLNQDKPYGQFVREQLAGDVLYPGSADGITALGFIAAGPWDFVGHAEVPETKIDGLAARNLDRDDMVTATMNAFCSTTVQCARCHNHKFDPVSMEDYYSLQAVFAAVDRADKAYDADPNIGKKRAELAAKLADLQQQKQAVDAKVREAGGADLIAVDTRLAELSKAGPAEEKPEFGYHSNIEPRQDVVKWVQVDLAKSVPIERLIYVGCHDDFNKIGAGFGFPIRFKIEASEYETFAAGVVTLVDQTQADFASPGVAPQTAVAPKGTSARYVRVTATKLAPRQNDFIFALAELIVLTPSGENVAAGKPVTSLDSIEAPVRWSRKNLVDGNYYGIKSAAAGEIVKLTEKRKEILERVLSKELKKDVELLAEAMKELEDALAGLPPQQQVYAGTIHAGSGTFVGTGASGGKPREIHVLLRGDVKRPDKIVGPGTIPIIPNEPSRFSLPSDHNEGDRRAALANWITHDKNPLTWRSIVNRVWQYHFGRGLVDSSGDFGRMGQMPTHPELLDWLAVEFRDEGQSLKTLHRLILLSSTYRQSSAHNEAAAKIDAGNQFLWRANRRRLDAESLRDATLAVAGKLGPKMGGPGYWDFVLEKPEHSPHYEYDKQNPDDPKTHRRSIYRFIVRSAPDPFMECLDCADPSQLVDKRNETQNALSALALLNNKFMLRMSEHFAFRATAAGRTPADQITAAFRLAITRDPTAEELRELTTYAEPHGMANACRVILNLNEFLFVD
jgi:mono/diheme cytochrome c family protein